MELDLAEPRVVDQRPATVVSVNVGRPRALFVRGKERVTGIFKEPVEGPVTIGELTVGRDVQMDKKHHGGRFKAAYVYAIEDYEWWSEELGREVSPGEFGDNLTTRGLKVNDAVVGERWQVGSAILEVTDPRIPCSTLRSRMGESGFVKRFAAAERFGAYCKVVAQGTVEAGDDVAIILKPDHGVTIVDVASAHYSSDRSAMLKLYERAGRPEHFADRVSSDV